MRALLLAVLLMASVLAGCSGNSGPSTTYVDCRGTSHTDDAHKCTQYVDCYPGQGPLPEGSQCKATCPTGPVYSGAAGVTTSPTTDTCGPCQPVCSTPPPHNDPPVLLVKLSANVTLVGGNVTVDASASTDPDDGLALIAVAAEDANGTLEPQFLYQAGAFRTANFTFRHAGPANITAVAQDTRGDSTIGVFPVYVDTAASLSNVAPLHLVAPTQAVSPTTCKGPTDQEALDTEMAFEANFPVAARATYVTATVTAGMVSIALCDPTGAAISQAGSGTVTSTKGTAFSASSGTSLYYVEAYSTAPNQDAGAVVVDVVVHYEPQP